MPDEGIFCGSEERNPKHTLLYDKAFVTKLLREKDRVWRKIGVFRGALKYFAEIQVAEAVDFAVKFLKIIGEMMKTFHVSSEGSDKNPGTEDKPFKNISTAASLAMPGDSVTVHEGIYRENIAPKRGGTSDHERIIYQAAPNADVIIKGSEEIKNWNLLKRGVWQTVIPNDFFGDFNPFKEIIQGDWFQPKRRKHHRGAVYLNGHWLTESSSKSRLFSTSNGNLLWYGEVNSENTMIWAQFSNHNPNNESVEINVRPTVFYPDNPGVNFITVKGFTLEQAATNWAPPTSEQIGLIGTHWSRGWIIEDNTIRYSICTGITLGKYGDKYDNTSNDEAEGYVSTIKNALANGWSKDYVGGHVVRNNHISHCEQAGIVGSLGAAFSEITGNTISHIHIRHLFSGAEMAGIKFHGAVDTLISENNIYKSDFGIWLDWMNQGTRVTCNKLHDNHRADIFLEVNHGPLVIDNNVLLSTRSLLVNSQGAAYVHNFFGGAIKVLFGETRKTPVLVPHSTEIADIIDNPGGDELFIHNLFLRNQNISFRYRRCKLPVADLENDYLKPRRSLRILLQSFDLHLFLPMKPEVCLSKHPTVKFPYYAELKKWNETAYEKIHPDMLDRTIRLDLPYLNYNGRPLNFDAAGFWKSVFIHQEYDV